jgi:Tify domain binding domain
MPADTDCVMPQNGEPVEYRTTQGERLLGGVATIDGSPGGQCGILCDCCATVISCSQFEAHAGACSLSLLSEFSRQLLAHVIPLPDLVLWPLILRQRLAARAIRPHLHFGKHLAAEDCRADAVQPAGA